VQVGRAGVAATATQALTQQERGEILAVLRDEIGGEKNAAVLAPPAYRNECHLGACQLSEGSAALAHLRFRLLVTTCVADSA
jgi:hypothetical protein